MSFSFACNKSSWMSMSLLVVPALVLGGCDQYSEVEPSRVSTAIGYTGYEKSTFELRGQYFDHGENDQVLTMEGAVSTFSVDVNTASYTMARSALRGGRLPDPASVRVEEFVNFFTYVYERPAEGPVAIHTEVAPAYFGSDEEVERHLMKIGLQARDISIEEMAHNNLVFLVDVSGSMSPPTRLPLAKQALHALLENLRPTDTVAIQTYANGSETVLEPTPVREFQKIDRAIQDLVAQGGTNGEGGIRDAYDMAERAFVEGGNNRVIILTDGDFNVGRRGDDVVEMVKGFRGREIAMTAVGFGRGNHQDHTMERLAREAHGNYFYIDTLEEAQRIFGRELPSTVEILASDVRVQVAFNEDAVSSYRLVGYEKRVLENEEFESEATNAAEVGPGHSVTVFYEVELYPGMDREGSLAEIRVRYKEELLGTSLEIRETVRAAELLSSFEEASEAFQFAAAVVEFAAVLRESGFVEGARFDEIRRVALGAAGVDAAARQEFAQLVSVAADLWE